MAARLIARSSIVTLSSTPFAFINCWSCPSNITLLHSAARSVIVTLECGRLLIWPLLFRFTSSLSASSTVVSPLSLMLYFHLLGLSTMRGNNREIDVYVDIPCRPPTRSHGKASSRHFYARVTLSSRCVPLRFDTLRYFAATSIYPD